MNKAEAIEALRSIDVPERTLKEWSKPHYTAEQLESLYTTIKGLKAKMDAALAQEALRV